MSVFYLFTPLLAWLCAGILKFLINSIRAKRWAFGLVGYGGFQSNHSAIVSSTAAFIALQEGIQHPAFGVAVTLAFIVILDAGALRRQIGKQAEAINLLTTQYQPSSVRLRERMGHTYMEIFGGIVVGITVAFVIWVFL